MDADLNLGENRIWTSWFGFILFMMAVATAKPCLQVWMEGHRCILCRLSRGTNSFGGRFYLHEFDMKADVESFLSYTFHQKIMLAHLRRKLESSMRDVGTAIGEQYFGGVADGLRHAVAEPHRIDIESARPIRFPGLAEYVDCGSNRRPNLVVSEDPRRLHEFWSTLSEPEKKDLFHADPFIGNRDGIPQIDRDRYNRQNLRALRTRAEMCGDLEGLNIYNKIADMIGSSGEGLPPYYLSYIDDELRFAYAFGNPDTADNIAIVLWPAARVRDGVRYAGLTLKQIRQAALSVDPQNETSVVLWGNYNQPRSMPEAIYPHMAENGAERVRQYHEGLRVTHQGQSSRNTTIGHSYGGVLAGHSAGGGNILDTDNLVFIGSSGAGVQGVADLRLTGVSPEDIGNHVFATMARHDSVQLMPDTHGVSPVARSFGATVFGTDSTRSEYRGGWNPSDHDAKVYFGSGNRSLHNIGLIVTGHGHLIEE
ncbi:alpha/beta hydrolase [Nocardia sp. NPDC057030]|uniref:alpha/beta hydrolase n=1 Tax=unclassified Nocardia TaxID=2637762 RepID=UPI00363FB54C